ncbi:MAG TPA: TRAP transporter small permease [Methylomirabilota bacterium]|jgi:TRAP-type mannitol/chloroaromatic compound transport system permease small subunit|nr:TRAP transporter small permease [Methylomirabilota bacterium]
MVGALLAVEQLAITWTRRLALAGGWMLLAASVVTVADALLRKLFSRPIQGTFEATELLLAVIIFLALPFTGLTDAHAVLDLTVNRLPRRAQMVIVGLNGLFCAAVLGLLSYEMGLLAAEYGRTARTTITMRIPIYPFIVSVTAAGWLAALGFVIQGLAAFCRAADRESRS